MKKGNKVNQVKIFSVLDVKAGAFSQPFFSRNNDTAIRDFKQACLNETHAFHNHASDYILHELGSWDEDTGLMNSYPPIAISTAAEHVARAADRFSQIGAK